jgi:hypothetical protein
VTLASTSGFSRAQLGRLMSQWATSALHRAGVGSLRLVASFLSAGAGPESFAAKALKVGAITGARFVVFGHTHRAWLAGNEERTVSYANSGTWTKCFVDSYERRLLEEESEFGLVEIRRKDATDEAVMALLKWVDAREALEPIRLFNTDEEEDADLNKPTPI